MPTAIRAILPLPQGPRRTHRFDTTPFGATVMKSFTIHWKRVRAISSPTNLRIGLFVLSIAAMVLGGAAGEKWS